MVKYLYVKLETVKLIEENIGHTFRFRKGLFKLNQISVVPELRWTINKWDLIKSNISLLFFCLCDLSIAESKELKPAYIILEYPSVC